MPHVIGFSRAWVPVSDVLIELMLDHCCVFVRGSPDLVDVYGACVISWQVLDNTPELSSSLINQSDAQTEDGHAMMKSDTLEPRSAWMSQLRDVSECEMHMTAVNKCAPTSQLVRTRHQRPTGKWYVDCEGAVGGCWKSRGNQHSVMDLGRGLSCVVSSLPPIFPLKIHLLPSDVWTPVSRSCLKTFVLP